MNSNFYTQNGLEINPSVPSANDKLKIQYTGLLTQNGANSVYTRLGYTTNNNEWCDVQDLEMYKNSRNEFSVEIPVKDSPTLNIAFHDGAGNWDNNCGLNYSFKIEQRPTW